jgi:hypothetical protein
MTGTPNIFTLGQIINRRLIVSTASLMKMEEKILGRAFITYYEK